MGEIDRENNVIFGEPLASPLAYRREVLAFCVMSALAAIAICLLVFTTPALRQAVGHMTNIKAARVDATPQEEELLFNQRAWLVPVCAAAYWVIMLTVLTSRKPRRPFIRGYVYWNTGRYAGPYRGAFSCGPWLIVALLVIPGQVMLRSRSDSAGAYACLAMALGIGVWFESLRYRAERVYGTRSD